jgi:hypothetical protein
MAIGLISAITSAITPMPILAAKMACFTTAISASGHTASLFSRRLMHDNGRSNKMEWPKMRREYMSEEKDHAGKEADRAGIIRAVETPLGFFVLVVFVAALGKDSASVFAKCIQIGLRQREGILRSPAR